MIDNNDNTGYEKQSETEEVMASSTMQPAAADTRQSTASNNKWHCSACTFANYADAVSCEVCGARKRIANDADDAGGDDHTWRCVKCTLINNKSNGRCAVRGGAKPLSLAEEVAEMNTNNTNRNGDRNGSGRYLCVYGYTPRSRTTHHRERI